MKVVDPVVYTVGVPISRQSTSILGRGQYVEIVKKAARNGHGKVPPERKKCPHIKQAIAS
jgi:hypothetical protein